MYRNNNKQTANLQNQSHHQAKIHQFPINSQDVQLLQSLSVMLGHTEVMSAIDLRDLKNAHNTKPNTKVVKCSIATKRVDRHQLLNQFSAKAQPINNETVKQSNIVTQFANTVGNTSPSKIVMPKLTPKSNISYLHSGSYKKSQHLQLQSIDPSTQPMHHPQPVQLPPQSNNNSAKDSTMTFSPLRINISLPSLCSQDLEQYSAQKQIITDIQNDIQILINKIKSNHCSESPSSRAHPMFSRSTNNHNNNDNNNNNSDVININLNNIRPHNQNQTRSNNSALKIKSNSNNHSPNLNNGINRQQTVYQQHQHQHQHQQHQQRQKPSSATTYFSNNNNTNSYMHAYSKKSVK